MKIKLSKAGVTKIQAVIIAVIIAVAAVVGVVYYVSLEPTPTPEQITIRAGFLVEIPTIDPHDWRAMMHEFFYQNVYESLFMVDKVGGVIKVVPQLVKDYEISADGKTYTMHLLEAVKFHDGTELKAEDVEWTFDRLLRRASGNAPWFAGLLEVGDTEAVSEYTVVFNLKVPSSVFIASLTGIAIMNRDLLMEHKLEGNFSEFGDYGTGWLNEGNDAGCGPYQMVEWDPRTGGRFKRFEDYYGGWKSGQVYEGVYIVMKEEATQKVALMNGDIDIADTELSSQVIKDLKNQEGIVVHENPMWWINTIFMNTQKPPTDDIHFRRAVSWIYDYDAYNTVVFPGKKAVGACPSTMDMHNDEVDRYYPTNLAKAQEELAKCQYSIEEINEMDLSIQTAAGYGWHESLGLVLKDSLAKLGITITVLDLPFTQLRENTQNLDKCPHFTSIGVAAYTPTVDNPFLSVYTNASWGISWFGASWFSNATVTEALMNAKSSVDPNDVERYFKLAQQYVAENAPAVWVGEPYNEAPMRDYIQGWAYYGIPGRNQRMYQWTVEKP